MQTFGDSSKDDVFNSIVAGDYSVHTAVYINGNFCGEDMIMQISTEQEVVNPASFAGNAIASSIDIEILKPSFDIPRMAKIELFVQVYNDEHSSDWLRHGIYFIDTRTVTHNDDGLDILKITGYDAMLKAEKDYDTSTAKFPMKDIDMVKDVASKMGVSIDSRTLAIVTKAYNVQVPTDYTLREILAGIAAMYAGNFIITPIGELRLVRINEMPEETNYLIDSAGNAITFGGVRILV